MPDWELWPLLCKWGLAAEHGIKSSPPFQFLNNTECVSLSVCVWIYLHVSINVQAISRFEWIIISCSFSRDIIIKPNEILMKWALLPADNDSFCDGGEWSGHSFDAAPLWLVQMVGAVVLGLPKRLRCLPSKAGQVLDPDRCGISVICKWCPRAELVPREDMTWLSRLFVPWLQGKWGQKYRGEDFTDYDALPKGIFTFWLLPKTIRSPLDPCTPCPNRFSSSSSSVTHRVRALLFCSHLQEQSFTYLEGRRG